MARIHRNELPKQNKIRNEKHTIYMDRVEYTALSSSPYGEEQTKYTGIVHDLPTTRHTHTIYRGPLCTVYVVSKNNCWCTA
jgi:hypothetical protein